MAAPMLIGDKQLLRRFAALQREAQGVVLSGAAVAGAVVVRDEAARLAPRLTGRGAENIDIESVKTSRTLATVNIGYNKTKAWWLRFQELGTKFHAAQPHLRPALDTKRGEAVASVGRVLQLGINAARGAR